MLLAITDQIIQNYVGKTQTYHKGVAYYSAQRVLDFYFDEEELYLEAKVIGTEEYEVSIYLWEDGSIKSFYCECPASYEYPGLCKHGVAVLKKAQEIFRSEENLSKQHKKTVNQIFSFFANLPKEFSKEPVKLEIIYILEKIARQNISSLELKIGRERLFVVKSIKNFLENLHNDVPIEFGKNFTFNPLIHEFSPSDQKVIDLLQEIYGQEKMLEDSSRGYYYQKSTSFKGKKVLLSPHILKRLFNLLQDTPFTAKIFDTEISSAQILQQDLPLEFNLDKEKNDLVLNLHLKDYLVPLTLEGEFFFYQNKIYCPSNKQRRYFLPFYEAIVNNQEKAIIISDEEKERFASEIIPFLKKVGSLHIDPKIEQSFHQEELQSKIYLDKIDNGIAAKIEFNYGEILINPLQENKKSFQDGTILIRDKEKEQKIIALFEQAHFGIAAEKFFLQEEEKIFTFLEKILPQLQNYGEIYYSDDFKKMKLKDPSAFSGGIKFNQSSNLLEFSFHYPDIDQEEIAQIFSSLQEKKKYHRLKDGSFLPLDNSELFTVAELLEQLNINPQELKEKVIHLPKYRAAYLDSCLREANLSGFQRNLAFKQMVQNIKEPKDMDFEEPEELKSILRDYQKVGYKWLKTLSSYGLGGILADDMGLGKTLQLLSFIVSEKEKTTKPALIIAPTSLIYNWQEEVEKFTPQMNCLVVCGPQKERQSQLQKLENVDLVITSYPLLRRDLALYQDLEFSFCFLDEAQQIKNPGTINAKSVKLLKAQNYFALTGTPIENSLTELWSIFDFTMPGYLLSHQKFSSKYEKPIIKNQDEKALQQLSQQINPFILRRMKKDVLKELPDKIESKMTVEMTPEQKKVYLSYLQKAKKEIWQEISAQGFEKSQIKILALLTRLRQICCHPALFLDNFTGNSGKMILLEETLQEIIQSGHRVLLFSQFTSMLQIISQYLNKQQIEYFYLDGSTKVELRGEMVKAFNGGKGKVFLISLKAGGTGLNLTGADVVIHFDPWWNPAIEEQATDRAYRIGQNKVVQVMKFIAKGTIEEKIYELQQKKKELIDSVIQPGENLLYKITEEELKNLLEIE